MTAAAFLAAPELEQHPALAESAGGIHGGERKAKVT